MSRTVTITNENSVIIERFVVSNRDAQKIISGYSTDWMEDYEREEYLADGE